MTIYAPLALPPVQRGISNFKYCCYNFHKGLKIRRGGLLKGIALKKIFTLLLVFIYSATLFAPALQAQDISLLGQGDDTNPPPAAVNSGPNTGDPNEDARALTDDQMAALPMERRLELIDAVSKEWTVMNTEERILLRLLASTPPEQAPTLVAALRANQHERLRRLDKVIDGAENVAFHEILQVKVLQSLTPEELMAKLENARIFPWSDKVLGVRFYYEEVDLRKDGTLHVEYWTNFLATGVKNAPVDIDPLEIVGIQFFADEERFNKSEGEFHFGPACNLLTLKRKQTGTELRAVVDVTLLFAGGLGFLRATTKIGKIAAALQVAFVAADVTISAYRKKIAQTKEGQTFLKSWDIARTVLAVYSIGRLLTGGSRAIFTRVRSRYMNLRPKVGASINSAERLALEAELNKLCRSAQIGGVCFVRGTKIHTKDGLRPIEKLNVGDLVWSRNERTGEESYKPVETIVVKKTDEVAFVTITNGHSVETIGATPNHPFWVNGQGWVPAGQLGTLSTLSRVGDYSSKVARVNVRPIETRVYNFVVAHNHTYFVGNMGTLVHNNNCAAIVVTAGKKFKDHFIRHKGLLEKVMGTKYPKFKSHGPVFLQDVGKAINTKVVQFVGNGTLKKGQDLCKIYRGRGITVVTKMDDEFVTILETGKGMDLGIVLR